MKIPTRILITQLFIISITIASLVLLIVYLPKLNFSFYSREKLTQNYAAEYYNSDFKFSQKIQDSALYGYIFFVIMFTIIVTLSIEVMTTVDEIPKSIKPEFWNFAIYAIISLLWSEIFCQITHQLVGKPRPDFHNRCWPNFNDIDTVSTSENSLFDLRNIFQARNSTGNFLECTNFKIVNKNSSYFDENRVFDCGTPDGFYCVQIGPETIENLEDDVKYLIYAESETKKLVENGFSSFISEGACLASCATTIISLFLLSKFSVFRKQKYHENSTATKMSALIWILFNIYMCFWVCQSRILDNLNDVVDTISGALAGFFIASGFYLVYFRPFWHKNCNISKLDEIIRDRPPSCEDEDSEARIKLMDYRRKRSEKLKVKITKINK